MIYKSLEYLQIQNSNIVYFIPNELLHVSAELPSSGN